MGPFSRVTSVVEFVGLFAWWKISRRDGLLLRGRVANHSPRITRFEFYFFYKKFMSFRVELFQVYSLLLLTDLCIGFYSPHGWELMISFVYKNFGIVNFLFK